MGKKPRLFLIDGSALAYRSHFAFIRNPLVNSKGVNTSAAYGFTMTLRSLLEKESPTHVAVVFDPRGKTFRHERFPEYKATRDKTPEELVDQLPAIKGIVEGLGIPVLEKEGFEADDVIGTLAVRAEKAGWDVMLVTGDKDFMQLVSPHVKMYNILKTGEDLIIVDEAGVEEKFGVAPSKVIDVLALMGDSSDNVPGVPGIGEKTATKLIQEHGDLETILADPTCVKAKGQQKKIAENIDLARLSQELVTIDTDVSLDVTVDDLVIGERDDQRLADYFREFEFRNLLDQVSAGAENDDHEYVLVDDETKYRALLEKVAQAKRFTFDTETTGLDAMSAELVGMSFAFETRQAYYLPANLEKPIFGKAASRARGGQGSLFDEESPSAEVGTSEDLQRFLEDLRPHFESDAIEKCGQNIKYDLTMLANYGVTLRGIGFDTMIASYLITPDLRQHNLDFLSLKYLNFRKIPTTDLIGKGRKQITMAEVPVADVSDYACEDVDICLRLREVLEPQLDELALRPLFDDIEMPLVTVLARMERNGITLDLDHFAKLSVSLGQQIEALEHQIHHLAGEPFNINSPRQLGEILFEKLELQKSTSMKRVKKTKTGYATDQTVLEAMADHPLPAKILEYRQLSKLKSTYVDALPLLVNERTGRIHTSFNQTVAATGRLSSADPNLQNIPIRTEVGRELRKAFIPQEGWKLISADYSQIELRLMAHLSGDPQLIAAFESGADIHAATAGLIFGFERDQVTPELRSRAKSINFGVLYGMGPHRLARETGMTFTEAKTFIGAYFETYPKVKAFIDQTIEGARMNGYVTTLLGRRRYIAEIGSSNQGVRANAENAAVNTPLQGSAADLIKKAMIAVDARLQESGVEARMLLQVHDELVLEAPENEVEDVVQMVRQEMTEAFELAVPIVVDVGVGDNWLEAH
ncbi:MAG: DNA polymerase I [Planctomycetota bacterium]